MFPSAPPDPAVLAFRPRAAQLPERCAISVPGLPGAIVLRRGQAGFESLPPGRAAEEFNREWGASIAAQSAMLFGSRYGWNKPGADPANYDDCGRPRASLADHL
jgi:hypothetical protein